MHLHVLLNIVLLCERTVADGTLEGLLTRVKALVLVQVTALYEGERAEVARVGLLAGVHAPVPQHVVLPLELHVAHIALVRLVVLLLPVQLQRRIVGEDERASGTGKERVDSVSLVLDKVRRCCFVDYSYEFFEDALALSLAVWHSTLGRVLRLLTIVPAKFYEQIF